ncbi:MAG: DUF1018 domain-containing protein [Nitrospinae bacterium]|nr:DUF1018 domain-containing protein [Nitrospinota bacterium]
MKASAERTAIIRHIFGRAREIGIDDDTLRDVALQLTGVRNPETGGGSISRLGIRQLRGLLAHLKERGASKKPEARAGWLASEAQVTLIHQLHRELTAMGDLRDPVGFMRSVTGRDQVEHLPRVGRRAVSAQGYIEILFDKKKKALEKGSKIISGEADSIPPDGIAFHKV